MISSTTPIGPNIRLKLKRVKKKVNGLSLDVRIKKVQIYHTRLLATNLSSTRENDVLIVGLGIRFRL